MVMTVSGYSKAAAIVSLEQDAVHLGLVRCTGSSLAAGVLPRRGTPWMGQGIVSTDALCADVNTYLRPSDQIMLPTSSY